MFDVNLIRRPNLKPKAVLQFLSNYAQIYPVQAIRDKLAIRDFPNQKPKDFVLKLYVSLISGGILVAKNY